MKLIADVLRRLVGLSPKEDLTDTQRIMRLEGWMVLMVILITTAHPGLQWLFRTFFGATALAAGVHK